MHSVPEIARPTASLVARSRSFVTLFEDMATSLSRLDSRADLTPDQFLDLGLHQMAGHEEDWAEFRAGCTLAKLAVMNWDEQRDFAAMNTRVEAALTIISAQLTRLMR